MRQGRIRQPPVLSKPVKVSVDEEKVFNKPQSPLPCHCRKKPPPILNRSTISPFLRLEMSSSHSTDLMSSL